MHTNITWPEKKSTQLLSVHPTHTKEYKTFIHPGGPDSERIVSGEELKILGFYFGEKPTAARHVFHLKRKFWARAWILRHLNKADVPPEDLVKIYNCLVRPILDYSAVIYHSLLNKGESRQLEDLQKKALRIVFGQKKTYEECPELARIPTLYQRRTELIDKFLLTVIKNDRYDS